MTAQYRAVFASRPGRDVAPTPTDRPTDRPRSIERRKVDRYLIDENWSETKDTKPVGREYMGRRRARRANRARDGAPGPARARAQGVASIDGS